MYIDVFEYNKICILSAVKNNRNHFIRFLYVTKLEMKKYKKHVTVSTVSNCTFQMKIRKRRNQTMGCKSEVHTESK